MMMMMVVVATMTRSSSGIHRAVSVWCVCCSLPYKPSAHTSELDAALFRLRISQKSKVLFFVRQIRRALSELQPQSVFSINQFVRLVLQPRPPHVILFSW